MASSRPTSAWDRPGSKYRPGPVVAQEPTKKFRSQPGGSPPGTIGEFWSWAFSDLKENTTRGVLAEYLVAKALGLPMDGKAAWEPYDLDSNNGSRIEVKASGFLQSWATPKHSEIRFSGLKAKSYDPHTGGYADEKTYHADIYVFCKQTSIEHSNYDVLDLDQWEFFVAPVQYLHQRNTASITEKRLRKDGIEPVSFDQLEGEFLTIENNQNLSSNTANSRELNRWANGSSEWNEESIEDWLSASPKTTEIARFKELLEYTVKNADVVIPGTGKYPGFACAYDIGVETCAAWSIRSGANFRLQIPFGAIKHHLPDNPELIDYYLDTLHASNGEFSAIEIKGGWPTVLVKDLTDNDVLALKTLAQEMSRIIKGSNPT
jgi:hypothetical protein